MPAKAGIQGERSVNSARWDGLTLRVRHTGESRYPGGAVVANGLDSGFRRSDAVE